MPDKPQYPADTPIYFGSWASYRIPFEPRDPISAAEAQQRRAYYVAYYNPAQQLTRFEKYLDGALAWTDEYDYWEHGPLKTRRMHKADGSVSEQQFDRTGRIIT